MKHYMTGVSVLLLGMLVSCGGGGGGASSGGSTGGGAGAPAVAAHIEETDPAVTFSGNWTAADSGWGWSGGSAMQTSVAGSSVSVTFTGNSIMWFGARGPEMAVALVSVDGAPGTQVDLYENTNDEIHSPAYTINGLSDGRHTLTIQNTGRPGGGTGVVVVDAFDVQGLLVSHLQDTNLDQVTYSGAGWTELNSDNSGLAWSGGGAHNPPEPTRGAHVTATAGDSATLTFRGTSVSWVGYVGPDAGIATVQVDGGAPTEVDTFAAAFKVQQVVFTATGLADANHTLKITATGRKNAQSTATKIFVDAFDVRKPGRRYQEWDPAVTYEGAWQDLARSSRTWNEGRVAVSNGRDSAGNFVGARANFHFTGTSVSWITCAKGSIGSANIYLDGVPMGTVNMNRSFPTEDYQIEGLRLDGLTNGPHTLTIEATGDGGYIVIDAFDVNP